MTNIRNKEKVIPISPMYFKRINREYLEQLYDNKFKNLDETEIFSKTVTTKTDRNRYYEESITKK